MRIGAIHTVALLILSALGMYALQQFSDQGTAVREGQQPQRSTHSPAASSVASKDGPALRTQESSESDLNTVVEENTVSEYVLEWEQRLLALQPFAGSAQPHPVLNDLPALEILQRYSKPALSGDGRAQYVLALMFNECQRSKNEWDLVWLEEQSGVDQELIDHLQARSLRCTGWDSDEAFRVSNGDPFEYWLDRAVSAGNPVAMLESAKLTYNFAHMAMEMAKSSGSTPTEAPEVPPAELVYEALNYAWHDPVLREAAVWEALTYFSRFSEAAHMEDANWNGEAGHYKRGALSDGWRLFWCTQTERCEVRPTLAVMEPYFYIYEIDEAVDMAIALHAAIEDQQWGALGL